MNAIRTTITTLAIGATALALVGAASASPPLHGTSTFMVTSDVILSSRQAGGNTIFTDIATYSANGDATGTASVTSRNVFHADGSAEIYGTGTFTGTFAGCGSEPLSVNLTTENHVSSNGDFRGTFTATGLNPIRLTGSFEGSIFDPVTTETFTYHC